MKKKQKIHDIDFLRRVLSYNSETGLFVWRTRPPEMFKTPRAHAIWNKRFAGKQAFISDDGNGYRRSCVDGIMYRAHRVAWAFTHDQWPSATIDHINGDPSDNRIANLRSVPQKDNCQNSKRPNTNTSGFSGVSWDKTRDKWTAYISRENKRIPLGRYDLLYEAVIARKAAETALGYHPNHGRD